AIIEGSRGKEFKAGASLKDMAQLLKEVGCTAALNLDGGTSTTMAVRATAEQLGLDRASVRSEDKYSVVFSNEEERKVKSALAIVPR
ncbi:MAG: phosphodiester glycosidase family protein, partial [Cyanobacteriota/Melainabacteria group bacterium]